MELSVDEVTALAESLIARTHPVNMLDVGGIGAPDLDDAVAAYRAAGRSALEHREELRWFHARVEPVDWVTAEQVMAAQVAPALDALDDAVGWWFLRKYPHWRLRLRNARHDDAAALLDRLTATGVVAGWSPGVYEPETAVFGGSAAMAVVHDLFCADSRGVLAFTLDNDEGLGQREASILLIRTLQSHAGLDWFESADVFHRLAVLRPIPAVDPVRVENLAGQMLPLLAVDDDGIGRLAQGIGDWRAAFAVAGARMGRAAADGCLDRGLRAVLAHIVIFHWNRLGLSGQAQGLLARAAVAAMLPPSP